jgi:hypothetical protein
MKKTKTGYVKLGFYLPAETVRDLDYLVSVSPDLSRSQVLVMLMGDTFKVIADMTRELEATAKKTGKTIDQVAWEKKHLDLFEGKLKQAKNLLREYA